MLETLCFMRLKTAGMVVGWIGIVGSLLMTIASAIIVANVDGISGSLVGNRYQNEHIEMYMYLIFLYSVILAFSVINLLASSMLVMGIVKERHLLLLPWICGNGVFLFLAIIFKIIFIGAAMFSDFGRILPFLIITLPFLGFKMYIFYGIYSLFKQIQSLNDEERPLILYQKMPTVENNVNNTYPSYLKI